MRFLAFLDGYIIQAFPKMKLKPDHLFFKCNGGEDTSPPIERNRVLTTVFCE